MDELCTMAKSGRLTRTGGMKHDVYGIRVHEHGQAFLGFVSNAISIPVTQCALIDL